jgi:hypothetical protein
MFMWGMRSGFPIENPATGKGRRSQDTGELMWHGITLLASPQQRSDESLNPFILALGGERGHFCRWFGSDHRQA